MTLRHLRSNTAHKRPTAGGLSDGQLAVAYHADSPGVFFKDTAGAVVKIGPVHVGTTAPNVAPAGSSGNSKGEAWLDTSGTNPVLKIWNGTAWATVSAVASGTVVTTADTGTVTGTMIADGTITNSDINASAAIADSKLATIATADKVSLSALNIDGGTDIGAALADVDLIIVDDGGGGTNRKAAVTRISDYTFAKVSGDVTISSAGVAAIGATKVTNAMLAGSIADSKLSTISTAGKVANSATTATNLNTASAIVARDASGNFAAGTITATLSGSASSCSGNAATATNLSSNRTFALTGDITGSVSSNLSSGASIATSIAAGVIVNADISAGAEIAVSKLANGTARQLLQTASNGTDVEWATNVDIPGTLDVTGAATFDSTVTCNSTGAITIPDGTTAQRPGTPAAGMIRLNTSLGQFEGYSGSAWGTIGGGAKGGGSDQVFFENDQVVTTNYTLTSGKNAVSAGPVTVNNGITVTVPSGSVWSIV